MMDKLLFEKPRATRTRLRFTRRYLHFYFYRIQVPHCTGSKQKHTKIIVRRIF